MTADSPFTEGEWDLLLEAIVAHEQDLHDLAEADAEDPDLYARHLADVEALVRIRATLTDWRNGR